MVTWGANTVHTFGTSTGPAPATSAPSSFSFGSSTTAPAPASSGFFGSPGPSTTGFGSPAPAPSTGFFGNPAPAPSTGIFGSTPAPSGGLFGAQPAPAGGLFGGGGGLFGNAPGSASGGFFGSAPATGGLFGSPPATGGIFGSTPASGGLFGSTSAPTGGLFGSPSGTYGAAQSQFGQQQQQQQFQQQVPQIPAQAALQAHLDAEARQEEARVTLALQTMHQAYTGHAVAATDSGSNVSAPFTSILYNPVSQQVRQMQWLHCMLPGQQSQHHHVQTITSPRPLQVSEADWNEAIVRNSDLNYMPTALVGAASLQARLLYQQEMADRCMQQLQSIQRVEQLVQSRSRAVEQELNLAVSKHAHQRKQLLDILKKVEILRCFNLPLQRDETVALKQLVDIYRQVNQLRANASALAETVKESSSTNAEHQRLISASSDDEISDSTTVPNSKQLIPILTEHREGLANLTETVKRDMRDIGLIQKRLAERVSIVDVLPPPTYG